MSEIKKIKPALSKGTRDFLPVEVAKRNHIFKIIKDVFRKYGFEEIETPAIERMETLTGKYGDEGDKLLFKILNSGDFLKDVPKDELAAANSSSTLKYIAEKGLRYDLTVPLARYVVQHQENLAFPFKRFHIGPVWRADRPQKGRYQEFYQCDADVIGSESLLNEVELTMIYAEVFNKLGIDVILYYNHRKVFDAIAEKLNLSDNLTEFTVIIDKLDKITWPEAQKELSVKLNLAESDLKFIREELSHYQLKIYDSIAEEQNLIGKSNDFMRVVSKFDEVGWEEVREELVSKLNLSESALEYVKDGLYNYRNDLLNSFAEKLGLNDRKSEFIKIIEKVYEIGWLGVQEELGNKLGLTQQHFAFIANELHHRIDLNVWFQGTKAGKIAHECISNYTDHMQKLLGYPVPEFKSGNHVTIEFNPTLARGLSYYTGLIWEVVINWKSKVNENIKIGSIASGGRYDNLTEIFGAKNMSGVGISFGIERIYDVMEELNLFPKAISQGVKVLFVPREEDMEEFAFQQVQALRNDNIAAELYLGNVKKKNHFKYIEDKHIAYFVEVGGDEKTTGKFRLRNVQTRDTQSDLTLNQLIQMLQ